MEWLQKRALRALGLTNWWVHIEALSARLRRLEEDVQTLSHGGDLRPRPQTLRAAPPPPPDRKGDKS